MTETLHSPLHSKHEELGASFTMFGAWEMPLKYGNELDEHRAVRETAGLFDLSHMGEIIVSGPQATEYLNYAFIADYSKLAVGRAKYNHMVEKDGRIIDDLIIYHVEDGTEDAHQARPLGVPLYISHLAYSNSNTRQCLRRSIH